MSGEWMTGSRGEIEDDFRLDDRGECKGWRGEGSLAGTSCEGFLDDRGEGIKSKGEGPRGEVIRSEVLVERGEKSGSVGWSCGETILSDDEFLVEREVS